MPPPARGQAGRPFPLPRPSLRHGRLARDSEAHPVPPLAAVAGTAPPGPHSPRGPCGRGRRGMPAAAPRPAPAWAAFPGTVAGKERPCPSVRPATAFPSDIGTPRMLRGRLQSCRYGRRNGIAGCGFHVPRRRLSRAARRPVPIVPGGGRRQGAASRVPEEAGGKSARHPGAR